MDVIYLDLYCVILPETDYRENSLHLCESTNKKMAQDIIKVFILFKYRKMLQHRCRAYFICTTKS